MQGEGEARVAFEQSVLLALGARRSGGGGRLGVVEETAEQGFLSRPLSCGIAGCGGGRWRVGGPINPSRCSANQQETTSRMCSLSMTCPPRSWSYGVSAG